VALKRSNYVITTISSLDGVAASDGAAWRHMARRQRAASLNQPVPVLMMVCDDLQTLVQWSGCNFSTFPKHACVAKFH